MQTMAAAPAAHTRETQETWRQRSKPAVARQPGRARCQPLAQVGAREAGPGPSCRITSLHALTGVTEGMADPRPPVVVDLDWNGGLAFTARDGGTSGCSTGGARPAPRRWSPLRRPRGLHGHRRRPHPDSRALRGAVAQRSTERRSRGCRAAAVRQDRAALQLDTNAPPRPDRAGHRALPGEVLLGLALDAPGHRAGTSVVRTGVRVGSDPASEGRRDMAASANRRAYIDWMRGLSVLFMIEAHSFDAWTLATVRTTPAYKVGELHRRPRGAHLPVPGRRVGRDGGLGPRPAERRPRRRLVVRAEARLADLRPGVPVPPAVVDTQPRRHGEGHLQGRHPQHHGAVHRGRRLDLGPAARTAAHASPPSRPSPARSAYATPIVRHAAWVAWLPDPIEWYIRPFPKLSVFTFFPWAGFVFAGAFVGEWLDTVKSPAEEWRDEPAPGRRRRPAHRGRASGRGCSRRPIPPATRSSGPRRRSTTSSRSASCSC